MNILSSSWWRSQIQFNFFHSLRSQLVLLFLAVSLIPLLTIGFLTYTQTQNALRVEAINKLIAVRDIKVNRIANYFEERLNNVKVLSRAPCTIKAIHAFDQAIVKMKESLATDEIGVMSHLRSLYLAKPDLIKADDGSPYSTSHPQYHQMFFENIEAYDFYDLFLVEPQNGIVIYSVKKEDDFGISLLNDTYVNTNISKVFQQAVMATDRDFTRLEDFAYYEPSNEAASFVASPIVEDSKLIGVLIFQLSVAQFDAIMQEHTGLGATGETVLVSSDDFLLRSNSRFSKKTTLFKQKMDNEATRAAAAGKTGVKEIIDYRGQLSIIAYTPLNISGVDWSLIAKIDEMEAFAVVTKMLNLMLSIIGIGTLIVIGVAFFFSNSIAQPVRNMTSIATQLAAGNLNLTVEVERQDEVGKMANAFRQMIINVKQVIEDIVKISKSLAEGDLSVMPNTEYKGDFVQIKNALEAALSHLQLVIKDIVQVSSQGLVEGHLHITPQAEYRGDLSQIKQALETAFSDLRQVIKDIVQISQGIADGNLSVTPQAQYRGDFIQIKNTLEAVLSNQWIIIEDIVQVSQGLAEGHLRVRSKAEYRGDLIQIRNALETALSNLSQVVEDIVQVSQGLAEGEQNITPVAKYRGDFIKIKEALETAAIKLAAATKQNLAQDWLKTGQNQLNDQMSGEQNIVELTHNIASFLTLYLEAQVGVCYLMEKLVNHHDRRLKLVASYAYTRRKNLAEEFSFSEGLVERAAREQKTLILTIDAGLEESVPRYILVTPFLYENTVKGVILLASFEAFTAIQLEFLDQVMSSIGIAVNSVESRDKMQELLQQSQTQAQKLQTQREELQHSNEELTSQSEELQNQAEELQSQAEELRQTNEALEERSRELERQQEEIQEKNLVLEKTKKAMEIKAQELQLASQYKSEFLANMSHELRTPLNSLLILAHLLAENKSGNLTDKQTEYAKTIHSAGSDLLTLINEILDLSKVEAGKIEAHIEEVSLTDLIETIEPKFRHVAEEKRLGFQITVADNLPPILHTDAQRLKQIINNLLSNAFKFTSEGEIKLDIQRPTHDLSLLKLDAAKTIAIQVSDTGIGIPKEKQQVIFEAFQQVDGTTSRRFGGTGLGLSISRQLARLLGGELQLHSEQGQGSTFILYLPETSPISPESQFNDSPTNEISRNYEVPVSKKAASPTNDEPPTEPIVDDRGQLKPNDKSLLIIEDDRKFSHILMELAREKDFKCLVAEDGKIGLQLAEQYQPNAIVLDVGLPQVDGWTVMEKLKENPQTRHIPVHFMSGSDQSSEAKKMGAIGYLLKPVSMAELGSAFKKIEHFMDQTVKKVLVIVNNEPRQQQIMELLKEVDIEITLASNREETCQHLQKIPFDCLIIDIDIKPDSGIKLLEQLQHEKQLNQIPVILYAERDLTESENTLLQNCANNVTVKAVRSPERLLDEATLFLHQVEANLSKEKRNMLRMVHDKQAILRDKKVLIVDDDVRNTFALATILEDHEMEIVVSKNGKEALELLEQHHDIALILMDIMMPEMDGYEAMQEIRKQHRFRQLPIIALTAKAMKGDKSKCIEAGANDYLSKPVDTDKLISLMRVWLYR